jgi:hypothetical protein
MITPRGGGKTSLTGWPSRSIWRYPIAMTRDITDETPTTFFGVVPLRRPLTFYKQTQ